MYQELPDAPWIEDCERCGYPRTDYWWHGRHYSNEDGFDDEDDDYSNLGKY